MGPRRGSVLIVALWALMLLGVFAVSLAEGARQKAVLGRRLERLDGLTGAALAGFEAAKAVLRQTDLTETYDAANELWAGDDEAFADYPVGEAAFTLLVPGSSPPRHGMTDEQSRLNLNTASPGQIAALLAGAAGLEEEEAVALAHAIVDWRDPDSQYGHPDHGAEDTDYDDLDVPYDCKDAPYETIEELMLVKGMTRALHDTIKPYVTAHGNGAVNLNTASRAVLVASGLAPSTADKVLVYRGGPDGIPGNGDDRVFQDAGTAASELDRMSPPLDAAERISLENLVSEGRLGTASEHFRVDCRARDRWGATLELEAVIDRKGKTYSWILSDAQWTSRS